MFARNRHIGVAKVCAEVRAFTFIGRVMKQMDVQAGNMTLKGLRLLEAESTEAITVSRCCRSSVDARPILEERPFVT